MPFYHAVGQLPRKRHVVFRRPDGGLYAEELMGHEGFVGTSSLLYHTYPPTTIKSARKVRDVIWEADEDTSLRHRHFLTSRARKGGSPTLDRVPLLFNADIGMLYVEPDENDAHFYRNSQADECVYVVEGQGTLESVFGDLAFRPGDYVVIHRNILHRWRLDLGKGPAKFVVFESRGHIRFPRRYMNEVGQLLEGAPYSERDIRRPTEVRPHDEKGDFPLLVKQYNAINEMVLDHHPFDVVGWDGCVYPLALNIEEFEPIVGRIHQPPPVHQTWALPGAVVCSFVPRPYDFDPDAVRVPYHHHNVDSDEVLFYADGDFMSRSGSGIGRGSISLHPAGFTHGPQPGSSERADTVDGTSEVAVMLDTFRPLQVFADATAVEDDRYWASWGGG